jgi:hypothetical protein
MTNDHSQLLLDIQKKSNIIVTNVRHVKYLKEEIESYKDLKIGFNTLRRLFGFLEKTKPTLATLNTLACYLEYRSYPDYLSNKSNFDAWYFQQKLLLIQQKTSLNKTDFSIINEGIQYTKNLVYVAYFVSNLIQKNNLSTLHYFFKKINFKNLLDSDLLQFATIITHSFYNIAPAKSLALYKDLMQHEIFRNSVPLLYIDYSHLNGVYLDVLALIEKNSKQNSDLLFVALMRFYKQFYTASISESEDLEFPENFNKLHPVLQGRYFGYKIMASNYVDRPLKKLLFDTCKKVKIYLFVEEILPALIIKEEYKILSALSEKYYEEIFESDHWTSKTINTIYLIALATISWENGSFKNAKKNLELVNLEEVELSYYEYVSLFYYLTKLKVSHAEKTIEKNAAALVTLKQLVLKTGFVRFLGASEKYTLN